MSLLSTAMCLVAASSLFWLLAALALTRAVAPQRAFAVAVVLILAPTAYGGFSLLRYAEPLAEPRPFAEAFVIFAVAAWLSQRRLAALACLIAAALFHPIMALAGFATLGLCLCVEDRRWLFAALAAAVVVLVAAMLGLPLFERLRSVIDPEWLTLLANRNAYLFPHLWPESSWALPIVQAITIVIAATHAQTPVRRILLASLVAGVAGLTVAFVAGRFEPILLLMQAQLWRLWWLTAVLAALALALRAIDPAAATAPRRLALAMLTVSWTLAQDSGLYAAVIAGCALAVDRWRGLTISNEIARALWLGAAVAVIAPIALDLPFLKMFAGQFQPDFTPSLLPLALKFALAPFLFAAVVFAAFGPPRVLGDASLAVRAAFVIALAALAGLMWNDASSYDRHIGIATKQTDLATLMPNKAGDVLWLYSSLEPWVWLGRPGWSADMQGAGAVFSRELALTYRDRARAQIEQGLRDETMIKRIPYRPKGFHPALTAQGVTSICKRPDAPAWIVAPVSEDAALDPALKARFWTPPAVRVEMLFKDDSVEFPRIDRYAIMDCAGHN